MKSRLVKYISGFFLTICLVAFTTPASAAISNQDSQWINTINIDKPAVDKDISSLTAGVDPGSIAPANLEKLNQNYRTYSSALSADAQRAMDHSEAIVVSEELLPTKTAYNKAMNNAYWAGFYGTQFVTDSLSGDGQKALEHLNKSRNNVAAYTTNMNEMQREYAIYYRTIETNN